MYKGPRLKTAPFAPFNKAFLPEAMLKKAGFVKSNDMPYERSHATRTTHQEFYKISQESMFGAPSQKVLRVDSLREKIIISENERGRGIFLSFGEVKQILIDESDPTFVTISSSDSRIRDMGFHMESPETAMSFTQRLETLIQARKIGDG